VNPTLSPETIMLVSTPKTVERHRVTSREQWHELRAKDVTASVIGALFGEYKYFGRLGLWETKVGRAPDIDASRMMRRGHALEPLAFEELADLRPAWRLHRLEDRYYFRDPVHRIGATPDGVAICPERGMGVIQVKTCGVLSKAQWFDENGQPYCPTWAALQALTEARLTGAKWAAVVVMVHDSDEELMIIDVPMIDDLWPVLQNEADLFWQTIAEGRMPEVDPERDAKAVARVFAQDNGEEIDLTADNEINELIDAREKLSAVKSAFDHAESAIEKIDTLIKAKMKFAQTARLSDGRSITAKTVKRKGFTVEPTSYRQIKIKGTAA
jgi:predicted phage-related endonuclease